MTTPAAPAAGTAPAGTTPTTTPPAGTTPTPTPPATPPTTTETGTYKTQAEVDAVVEARLARERAKYADHDDLKAKAAELDALKAGQASEQDKAVAAAKKDTETEVTQRFQGILRASAIREAAAGLNFMDAADALAQLHVLGKLDTIAVDKQGNVDTEAVKRELAALVTAKPYLVKKTEEAPPPPASPAQAGVGGASSTTSTKPDVAPGMGRLRAGYAAISSKGNGSA